MCRAHLDRYTTTRGIPFSTLLRVELPDTQGVTGSQGSQGNQLSAHGQYLWLQDAQGESLISVVEQLEQQVHEERFRHWRAKQRLEEEVALRKGLEARLAAVEAELARLRG